MIIKTISKNCRLKKRNLLALYIFSKMGQVNTQSKSKSV